MQMIYIFPSNVIRLTRKSRPKEPRCSEETVQISVIKFQISEITSHISEIKLQISANILRYPERMADFSNKIQISVGLLT